MFNEKGFENNLMGVEWGVMNPMPKDVINQLSCICEPSQITSIFWTLLARLQKYIDFVFILSWQYYPHWALEFTKVILLKRIHLIFPNIA